MGQPADKDVDDGQSPQEPAGKVEHDARGKAVWKWAADVLENTSVLLKRLENRALALEPTARVPILGGAKEGKAPGRRDAKHKGAGDLVLEQPPKTGGGFDPYNSH
jgi:hypothetical protein